MLPAGEVGLDVLADAKYFVTLSLRRMDKSVPTERVPPKSPAWVEVSDEQSPLLRRLGSIIARGISSSAEETHGRKDRGSKWKHRAL